MVREGDIQLNYLDLDYSFLITSLVANDTSKEEWYINLGATMHMTHKKEWFSSLDDNESYGERVALRDDRAHMVKGQGTIPIKMPHGGVKLHGIPC